MRERLINRRQQGDLGELSAMEWLTRQGATVLAPLGHSPDYDLVAEIGGRLVRVQVKTSTFRQATPNGHERWSVQLATNGGNQSWSGEASKLDPTRVDSVFILVGDGRRWFIPAASLEALTAITLGGIKYSEYEIESTSGIEALVYGSAEPRLNSSTPKGVYPRGQRTATVNRQASAFAGSTPAAPIESSNGQIDRPRFERIPARNSQTILGAKRRLGIPVGPCTAAGLNIGDRMRVRADGPGRVILERIELGADTLAPDELPGLELADGS